jgi:hypothetical protein
VTTAAIEPGICHPRRNAPTAVTGIRILIKDPPKVVRIEVVGTSLD